MPKIIEFLMLDPKDPTIIVGETTSKDIRNELNISGNQFQYWLSKNETYKGCIIVEKNINNISDDEKQFDQLICINSRGWKYYATPECKIYVLHKGSKRKYLSLYKKTNRDNLYFVKINGKEESAIRIFAKAFLGLKPNQVCYLQGKLSLENIKIYSKQHLARKTGKMAKSIPVGLFINKKKVNEWTSARDAAKDLYISNQTVCDYCNQKTKKPLYDLRWLA